MPRKKIASKLIKPLINYFKLHKKICYLETNWDKNVPIYEYFGFKILEKTVVPGSNFNIMLCYLMVNNWWYNLIIIILN